MACAGKWNCAETSASQLIYTKFTFVNLK